VTAMWHTLRLYAARLPRGECPLRQQRGQSSEPCHRDHWLDRRRHDALSLHHADNGTTGREFRSLPLVERPVRRRVHPQQRLERRLPIRLHQCRMGCDRGLWTPWSIARERDLAGHVAAITPGDRRHPLGPGWREESRRELQNSFADFLACRAKSIPHLLR
jgi:hypothetical protein